MVIPLAELIEVFFSDFLLSSEPFTFGGDTATLGTITGSVQMPGMKIVQHWPFFASPHWMDEPLSCFPSPHLQTGSLPAEFLISAFNAGTVLCQTSAVVPVLPPRLPTSQCFNPSSPAAFIICGSVIHRLCKSEILNSPTKHLGQKAAVSGNPVWKLCQNQWRSSSLGPGHCFLQGALNQGQNGASC